MPHDIGPQLKREIERLQPEQQARLLEVARRMNETELPKGMPWAEMKRFAGTLPDADAAEILAAIEEDCEKVDLDGW